MNEQINDTSSEVVETPRDAQAVFTDMLNAEESGNDKPEVVNDNVETEDDEEVEDNKVAPSPVMPSPSEVEDHRAASHIPYRNWCDHCQQRALGEKRGQHAKPEKTDVSVIGIDYFFITSGGLKTKTELSDGHS